MKNLLPLAVTALLAACGVPAENEEAGAVGVSRSALTMSVPFWFGKSHFTTGYGTLSDTVNNGILGWSGPSVQTPFGATQANAMTFEAEGASDDAEAVLSWIAYAPSTGDHRLKGPRQALIDGYARASAIFQSAGVQVYVCVRVRVNGVVRKDVWHEVAVVDTSYGERTSSFSSIVMPIAHDFTVFAKTGDPIKYEVALFTHASLSTLGSAFVAIRDFGVQTSSVPNTSHSILLYAP